MRKSGWNRWRQRCVAMSAAVFLSTTVLFAPAAAALGLGEIETQSALNERFSAEIELLDTRDLDASEVIASLASTDDFRRVGVERFFFLTSLKFEVVRNSRGNLVIKASSQQPITEPYLNFLVEVLWPSGRLLKEYTVLLDPPTFTHSAAAPVAAPSRQSTDIASAGRVQRTQPGTPAAPPAVAPSTGAQVRTPAPKTTANDGTYGRTTRNDTLWAIANQTLPSGDVTPQQNMLAIQRLNPNAFIDNNVNLLKAGVVLRLPNESQALEVDRSSAVAQVQEQTRAWRSGTPVQSLAATPQPAQDAPAETASAAPIDATSRGPGEAEAAGPKTDGRLTIVAADATGVVDGTETTGAGETQTTVAGDPAAQEQIESLARQVDELTYQLDLQKRGVEEQISTREKQINLKDQQIAQLQQQLKAIQDAGGAQPQDQSTPQNTADTPFWQKPAVLGGALGGLALLLAGLLFKKRRENAANEFGLDEFEDTQPSFELGPTGTSDVVTPLADADLVGDLSDADLALDRADDIRSEANLTQEFGALADSDELSDDDLFGPSDEAPAAAPSGSEEAPQTSDVIGEADIYIAYGRYPQAIALLQGAVETNPKDHTVRMRLLEVSAETKDAESYAEQQRLLNEHCDDAATLAAADALFASLDGDLRDQITALGDSSDGGAIASAAAGAALAAGAASVLADDDLTQDVSDGDLDLTSDLEALDLDGSEADSVDAVDSLADDADALLTGDFEMDAADLELGGDAELDLDLSDAAAELDIESGTDADFELDLEDDSLETLSDVVDDAASVAESSLDAEFDIPSVDTDEFATNVDMEPASIDLGIDEAAEVEDFELDLDLGSDDDASDALGGDLGIDFPDETTELERVVAETDDDQLLDEIERSLDELEADGLLTPDLNDEGEFSFDDDADTSATKLDLARAYIDMGDDDGAREILGEVISEGDSDQQGEANELLNKL